MYATSPWRTSRRYVSRTPGGITCAGGISSPRSASRSATPPLTRRQRYGATMPLALARAGGLETSAFAFASDLADEGVDDGAREPPGARRPRRDHARVLVPRACATSSRTTRAGRCGCSRAARCTSRPTWRARTARIAAARRRAGGARATCSRETCRAAAARGMRVDAWTIFLHADRADENQDCVTVNAFGDRYPADLCPAQPRRRARTRARSSPTWAATTSRSIFAESLHYHPVRARPRARALPDRARDEGALPARALLLRALPRARGGERRRRRRGGACGGARRGRARVRRPRRGRHRRARAGDARRRRRRRAARLPRRARRHRDDARGRGRPRSRARRASASSSWIRAARSRATGPAARGRAGRRRSAGGRHRPARARRASAPRSQVLAYAADVERVRLDLEAYRGALGDATVSVVLRPIPPDCETAENLAAKLALARELGLQRADFYHYGFLRLETLDLDPRRVRARPDAVRPADQGRRGRRPGRRARGARSTSRSPAAASPPSTGSIPAEARVPRDRRRAGRSSRPGSSTCTRTSSTRSPTGASTPIRSPRSRA